MITIKKMKPVEVSNYLKDSNFCDKKNLIVSDLTYFIGDCNILFLKSLLFKNRGENDIKVLLNHLEVDGLIMIDNKINANVELLKTLNNNGYKLLLVDFL